MEKEEKKTGTREADAPLAPFVRVVVVLLAW